MLNVSLLDSYDTEWRILTERSYNVLLEGAVTATDAVLHLLQPHIGQPIVLHQPHNPLELPGRETGTLILRDAAELSADEQHRLIVWIDETGPRTRIISTTERTLFALVADGRFEAALYYRLNSMLLRVGAQDHAGLPSDDEAVRRLESPTTGSLLPVA